MTSLDLLLLLAIASIAASPLLAVVQQGRWLLVGSYVVQLLILLSMHGAVTPSESQIELLGHALTFQLDALGWYLGLITLGAGVLAAAFGAGSWSDRYRKHGFSVRWLYAGLQANVASMLLLLTAHDFLSLFITWEMVSWSGLILVLLNGGESVRAGVRYITYGFAGAMALMAATGIAYSATGSFSFEALASTYQQLPTLYQWSLVLLLVFAFSVKMGMLPTHLWQAPAYALTPGPAAAFLGAISSRMGYFAIALVVIKLITISGVAQLAIWQNIFTLQDLFAWIAALTIILPTYTALRQSDARMLLAWHGIGQGGYMLLGLWLGDSMGSAGGMAHVFNYATNQAVLFMAVSAVYLRAGTTDLNRLGGLVTRMPLTFLAMLVGIIGLAGLPPMNGFVSKWLVYRALVTEGMPLLFVASVIGTLGTILSVYKLIHNTFLGQLRVEHEQVTEAPWSMVVPMMILSGLILLTGIAPGIVLSWVADAQLAIGLQPVAYTVGGVDSPGGSLDMLWINGVLFAGFGIGALVFYGLGGRSKRVHQLDNYAGGHFLTAEVQYQYSDNFYAGLMHRIRPWYRGSFAWFEQSLVSFVDTGSLFVQGFFRQSQTTVWLLLATTAIATWGMWHALS